MLVTVIQQLQRQAVARKQSRQIVKSQIGDGHHRLIGWHIVRSDRRDLLHDDANEVVDDRISHQLLFFCLAEHECFVVRIVTRQRQFLRIEQARLAARDRVAHV